MSKLDFNVHLAMTQIRAELALYTPVVNAHKISRLFIFPFHDKDQPELRRKALSVSHAIRKYIPYILLADHFKLVMIYNVRLILVASKVSK